MHKVFIGLGSNKGDRRNNLRKAKELMSQKGLNPVKTSCVYESAPVMMESDFSFYNAAVLVETQKSPLEVLDVLEEIEILLGRPKEHKGRYLDRIMDLDILFFDDLILKDERLLVPHKDLEQREFVLLPLLDIAPDMLSPKSGKTLKDIYGSFSDKGSCRKVSTEKF